MPCWRPPDCVRDDIDQECPIAFSDVDTATRAFVGADPMQLAIELSGETTVTDAVRAALRPFTGDDGRITLPGWYRITIADG
jgi:hypothetical protein